MGDIPRGSFKVSRQNSLSLRAPAKVNLTLEVLRKRADGYHEISSILQTIDLSDEIYIEPGEGLEVIYEGGENFGIDLAYKAASLLLRYRKFPGVKIRIKKVIPPAAGLGGGSSDAAAVLEGVNQLWGLGLGKEELAQLGAELGSDVPFFIFKGTALAQGRGEKISPLPSPQGKYLLNLIVPPIKVPQAKTAFLYSLIEPSLSTSGEYTRKLQHKLINGQAIEPEDLYNVFERIVFNIFPELEKYRKALLEAGAESVHLAGSGLALFSWEKDEEKARWVNFKLRSIGPAGFLVRLI